MSPLPPGLTDAFVVTHEGSAADGTRFVANGHLLLAQTLLPTARRAAEVTALPTETVEALLRAVPAPAQWMSVAALERRGARYQTPSGVALAVASVDLVRAARPAIELGTRGRHDVVLLRDGGRVVGALMPVQSADESDASPTSVETLSAPVETPTEGTYSVLVLTTAVPRIDPVAIGRSLNALFPGTALVRADEAGAVFEHPRVEGCAMPVMAVVSVPRALPDRETLAELRAHTRDWPGVDAALASARAGVWVSDGILHSLAPAARMDRLFGLLLAVLEHVPACALAWGPSGRLVNPAVFRQAVHADDDEVLVRCVLNVRAFRTGPEERTMDTLGLRPFGMPDYLCTFPASGVDGNAVARKLFHYAIQAFHRGHVIADGDTVDGLAPGERWRCQILPAPISPARTVVEFVVPSPADPADLGGGSYLESFVVPRVGPVWIVQTEALVAMGDRLRVQGAEYVVERVDVARSPFDPPPPRRLALLLCDPPAPPPAHGEVRFVRSAALPRP